VPMTVYVCRPARARARATVEPTPVAPTVEPV
jgi:hypothetical protein